MALENRLRKPRTAAGFVPEACKTQAWKTLETSRHMALENCLGKLPPKASNSSKIRGRSMQNTSLKNSRNVTFGIHKTCLSRHMALENRLPKPPEKLSERHLWNPWKTCLSWHMALENRLRKPRTAAGFVPEACKTQARKTLETSPLKPIKKNMSITAHGLGSMQNTSLKNSQNVTREQLYRHRWCPSGWLRQPSRPQHSSSTRISPRWLGQQDIQCPPDRFRKTRTATSTKHVGKPNSYASLEQQTLGTSPLESIKNMSLTAHGLGKPPAKASNSSRIPARSIQNTSLKNSRNLTFGIHKKQAFHDTWLKKTACESLEQQQDSCPKQTTSKTRVDYFLTIRLSAFPRQISDY